MKLAADTDGMIKLNKTGILEMLAQHAEILIGPEVYREAVEDGKARGYTDAVEIEEIVRRMIQQKRPRAHAETRRILQGVHLGLGEQEALGLYFSESADAIVSDDRGFLKLLDAHGIPYLTPAAALVMLFEHDILSQEQAHAALEQLKPSIRDEQYQAARRDIELSGRNGL
jgi:hypothetical protein